MALSDLSPLERELTDDDIVVIEGQDGTFKVSVGTLRNHLAMSVDQRMVEIEERLRTSLGEKVSEAVTRVETLDRVYYSLVRDYNSHSSSIEAIKENVMEILNNINRENP